jgi:hypothetical protein
MKWLKSIDWFVCVTERGVFHSEGTAFLNIEFEISQGK